MNTKELAKKLHISFHHSHRDKYQSVNPYRQWFYIVVSFFVLAVVVLVLSTFMYYEIINGNFFSVGEAQAPISHSIDKAKLEATVNFFEAKRERFEAEKATPSTFVDPGI